MFHDTVLTMELLLSLGLIFMTMCNSSFTIHIYDARSYVFGRYGIGHIYSFLNLLNRLPSILAILNPYTCEVVATNGKPSFINPN